MSRQVDFRVTGRPGATVFRFLPLSEAARIFVDANIKLEPSQWHEGSFAVEDRFARDLAALLTKKASMCRTYSRNIDLLAGRAMQGRGFTGCLARCFRHSDSDRSENDHKSVRGGSKDSRGEALVLSKPVSTDARNCMSLAR